ncbi:MAG: hypothetical protein V1784_08060 [bacterium]
MKFVLAVAILLVRCSLLDAALWDQISLRGYLRETPILWKASPDTMGSQTYRFDNLLHTRQNLRWHPMTTLRMGFELKTRLLIGESAQDMLALTNMATLVEPYFCWSRTFVDEEHIVLTSMIDRAWAKWTRGPLEITLGRQRVAWGTNLVWNPIDLFNPALPLDFDSEEKPGNDAARLEWYLGPNSELDVAFVPQRDPDSSAAAIRLKLNRWEYDWIAIAGRRGPVAVAGFAWAGSIHGGGFRGEALYAMPRQSSMHEPNYLTLAVSGDYAFRSSLYLHAEVLYKERGTTGNAGRFHLLEAYRRGELTSARWALFGEVARDLSPLVRVSGVAILNPSDGSWYLGPTFTLSVLTNLDFFATALLFGGDAGTEFGDNSEILMGRLKFSF